MNKARIVCMALIILAIIQSQSSNLRHIARHFITGNKSDSNYRRIQRFLAQAPINYDQIAKLLYRLFALNDVIISLDRTNWQWGRCNINIFMLSVVYQGIAIPIYWSLLNKKGNSNADERMQLLQRFIDTFGKDSIKLVLADREFIGYDWFTWLDKQHIKFAIRIKKNSKVVNRFGHDVQVKTLLRSLRPHETYRHGRLLDIYGCKVRVFATLSRANDKVIVATNDNDCIDAMAYYAKRWEIETLFSCLKSKGFNLEETHLTQPDRVSNLVALCALAFSWAYHIGIRVDKGNSYKRILKNHCRPQCSLFALGLDTLIDGLRQFLFADNVFVFDDLVSYLSPHPRPLTWL